MNGVWRTALLFHTSRRAQPWLLAAGTALLAASAVVDAAGAGSEFAVSVIFARMCAVNLFLYSLLLGAAVTRRILSIRTIALIPGARMQLLLGLLLAPLPVAMCVGLPMMWLDPHLRIPAAAGPRDLAVILWASTTLFVIWAFVGSRSAWVGFASLTALVILLPRLMPFLHDAFSTSRGADALGCLALAVSLVFLFWGIRAPAISPPLDQTGWALPWPQRTRAASASIQSLPSGIRLRAALATLLLGRASRLSSVREYAGAILISNLGVLTIGLLPGLLLHRRSIPFTYQLAPVLSMCVLGIQGLRLAAGIAGGSRRAWISGQRTRAELFSAAERVGWQCFAALALPTILVCTLEWHILPQAAAPAGGPWTSADGPRLFCIALESACCGFYLGLGSLGGKAQSERRVSVWMLISWMAVLYPIFLPLTPEAQSKAAWIVQISLLSSALALRTIAAIRWRQIDWLGRAPPRATVRGPR